MKNLPKTTQFLVLIRYDLYFAMNIQHSIQTTQHIRHTYAWMFLLLKMSTQGPYTNKHIVTPIRITSPCKNQNITGNRFSLVPNSDSSNFLFALPPFLVSCSGLLIAILHADFVSCMWKKKKSRMWHCTGFCGQTQARLCDMPIWHPLHFSSRRNSTCCSCDWDSGINAWTLIPCQLKHLRILWLISSSCHQELWQYPLFSVHSELDYFFFFLGGCLFFFFNPTPESCIWMIECS